MPDRNRCATCLAAERITEANLQELISLANAMEKPEFSRLELSQFNDRFHKIIVEAANNPSLTHLHDQIK